jgi:hypothetical protein
MSIALSPTRHISLVLFDIGSGKRFVSTTVLMRFRNIGEHALGYPRLYLILDEERLEIGFNNDQTGLWANVEIATFDKILSARKVEGRFEGFEFEVSAEQLKLLREFRAMLVTEK